MQVTTFSDGDKSWLEPKVETCVDVLVFRYNEELHSDKDKWRGGRVGTIVQTRETQTKIQKKGHHKDEITLID